VLELLMAAALATAGAAQSDAATQVRGVVVDETGKPLADVLVCAVPDRVPLVTAEVARSPLARTGADGRFAITTVASEVLFLAEGRVHIASWPPSRAALQPIVLPRAHTLAGVVRGPDGGPLVGVHVEARDWFDEAPFLNNGTRHMFVRPRTAARTDAGGRFVLAGCYESAIVVEITGTGIEPLVLAPVCCADPLDVTVQRFEPVVAVVLDPAGKPVPDQTVNWKTGRRVLGGKGGWGSRTDEKGRALAPVGDVSEAWCSRGWQQSGRVPVLTAKATIGRGAREVQLQLAPSVVPRLEQAVSLRAFDPAGAPLSAFRVAVLVADGVAGVDSVGIPEHVVVEQRAFRVTQREIAAMQLAARTMTESAQGVARLAPALWDANAHGLLTVVDAPGCALEALPVARAEEISVRLRAACVVTGKVVDGGSGAGVGGVRVWTLSKLVHFHQDWWEENPDQFDPSLGAVVTAADGSFRLDRVPAGERHLIVDAPGRPAARPLLVTCAAGQAQSDVRIELPPLLTITGQTDVKARSGLAIRLHPHREAGHSPVPDTDWDFSRSFALLADGTFTATGITPGDYDVQLLVSCGFRSGAPRKVATGVMAKIANDTRKISISLADALAELPARLHGTVRSTVPWSRLGVISLETAASYISGWLLRGPVAPVQHDGTFQLSEFAGNRTVAVFDLMTGAILGSVEAATVEAGTERHLDVTIEATAIDVAIGGPGWLAGRCYTLEVRPEQVALPPGVGGLRFDLLQRERPGYCGIGCRLLPGERTARLFLPHGVHQLCLLPTEDESAGPSRVVQTGSVKVNVAEKPLEIALELPAMK
jgi:hypothetical protein